MKKKKMSPPKVRRVPVQVDLPLDLAICIDGISELSGVGKDTLILVYLATHLYFKKERP